MYTWYSSTATIRLKRDYTPYATCGSGSPGAMKLVFAFFCAFAAEHLAIVGELAVC
jgi:hypothetical protein